MTPHLSPVACLRRNWRRYLLILVAIVVVVIGYFYLLHQRIDDRQRRQAEARRERAALCAAINELPAEIGKALNLSEQRRALLTPAVTVPRADLTDDERAELARITVELEAAIADLSEPADCNPNGAAR